MTKPLCVLVIEDSEDDTSLLIRELRRADYQPTFKRVESPEALSGALAAQIWDLVISDHTMPLLTGTDALEIVKKSGLDIPFLFYSGTLGEEAAVEAMKAGADDFIMKGNLGPLITAVGRVLDEAKTRQEHKKAQAQVEHQQEQIRVLHDLHLAIAATLDLRSALNLLVSKMERMLPYPVWISVRLVNPENAMLESITSANPEETEQGGNGWRAGRGLSELVFESRAPLVIRNAQLNPGVLHPEFFRKHGLVSYLGVPLIARDDVLGVLGLYTKVEHEFRGEEIEFLGALVNQAAIAIHNSRLYEHTRREALELVKANRKSRNS